MSMDSCFVNSYCISAISYPTAELKTVKETSIKEAKVETETQLVTSEFKISD